MKQSLAVLAVVGPLIVGLGTACEASSPASMSAPVTSAIPDLSSPLVIPPADSSTPTTSTLSSEGLTYYANYSAVRAAGAAPLYQGQSGYQPELDRDGDGVACEMESTSPAPLAAPPPTPPAAPPALPLHLPVARLVDLPIIGTVTLLAPRASRRCTGLTPVIAPG
jgi:hypothetical protein